MTAPTGTNNNNNNRKRRVCLFGSSANPPTGEQGHVGIVRALALLSYDEFDEIRVVPVYSHPFSSKRKQLAPFEHRKNMCQLAFLQIPNVTVSNAEQVLYEQKLKQQSSTSNEKVESTSTISVGTADLLEFFQDEECTLCLGADTFLDLTSGKWRRTQDILDLCQGRFVVLYRKEDGDDAVVDAETDGNVNNSNGPDNPQMQQLQEEIQKLNDTYGDQSAHLLHIPTLGAVSSTMIRTMSSASSLGNCADRSSHSEKEGDQQQIQQEQADQYLKRSVTPGVFDYMVEHQLYGFGGDETGSSSTISEEVASGS